MLAHFENDPTYGALWQLQDMTIRTETRFTGAAAAGHILALSQTGSHPFTVSPPVPFAHLIL